MIFSATRRPVAPTPDSLRLARCAYLFLQRSRDDILRMRCRAAYTAPFPFWHRSRSLSRSGRPTGNEQPRDAGRRPRGGSVSGLTTLPTQTLQAQPIAAQQATTQHAPAMRQRVPSRPVLPPTDIPLDPPAPSPQEGKAPRVATRNVEYVAFDHKAMTYAVSHAMRQAVMAIWQDTLALLAVGALQPDVAAAVRRVARAQAMTAVASALLAALLVLGDQPWALWALVFTVIAGAGAWLADVLLQQRDTSLFAGIILLCSQLALLVWGFELDGPRMALLAFVPALALFALRVAGPTIATYTTAALLALYGAWTLLHVRDIFPTAMHWSHANAVAFDALVASGGLFLTVLALLDVQRRRDMELRRALDASRSHYRSQSKGDEGRVADSHFADGRAADGHVAYVRLLVELEADVERLGQALTGELGTTGWPRLARPDETTLLRLEELIDFAAERINTLQRDHEERVRLEGALARLLHAVELLDLGRSPRWPEPSGTAVDSVVARLRELHPDGAPARAASSPSVFAYSSASGIQLNPDGSTPTGVLLPWRPLKGEAGA